MAHGRQAILLAEDDLVVWTASDRLRWAGIAILSLAVLTGPLALGSAASWAWAGLWGLAALSVLVTIVVWFMEGRASIVPSPALLAAAAVAIVAALQLIPVPTGLFYLAGENTREIHRLLGYGSSLWRASLEPARTVEALLKATLVLMACIGALALPRTKGMLFALVGAVCVAVVASSVAGIVQGNGQTEKIYGIVDLAGRSEDTAAGSAALAPELSSGVGRVEGVRLGDALFFRRVCGLPDVFGSYPNSNHFAGLVEIALPVLLALFLALYAARHRGWRDEGGFLHSTQGNIVLLLAFVIVLGTGAVVCAHSFAGLGGLAAGLAVTAALFSRSRRMTAVVVISGVLLGFFAFGIALALRPDILSVLPDILQAKFAGRAGIWRSAAGAVGDFPLTGSGLGSFSSVIPRYEVTEAKHFFAHNDYIQLAVEAGLPAAALVVGLAAWQVARLAKAASNGDTPYCSALCAGAVGSCTAIAFHSFFDFNMHVPANALALAVVVCAAVVASGAVRLTTDSVAFTQTVLLEGRRRLILPAVVVVALIAVGAVRAADVVRVDLLKRKSREAIAGIAQAPSPQLAPRLQAAYAGAEKAAALSPDDGEVRYQAAILAAALSRLEADSSRSAALRDESLKHVISAARSSPACTFATLTALTMGVRDNGVARKWPMSSFDYTDRIARMLFEEGQNDEGLAWTRQALSLAATARGELASRTNAVVADLVKRFGTYDRISKAVPDTFAGHLVFAEGLKAADLASAALDEYAAAAECARAGAADLDERSVAQVAQALSDRGMTQAALDLFESVLARHRRWQYLRLSYARMLADSGRAEEAVSQIETILSAHPADWLREDALSLGKSVGRK